MQHISPEELKERLAQNELLQLIDVRQSFEHEQYNIGGDLIPLDEIIYHAEKISKTDPVVVYCKAGIRSQIAIQRLQEKFGFTNLINLQGGIEAWKKYCLTS